jgi:multiple sugar transport system ATP-binding protein
MEHNRNIYVRQAYRKKYEERYRAVSESFSVSADSASGWCDRACRPIDTTAIAASTAGKAVATFAGGNRLELPVAASSLANGSSITLGIRPQHISIGGDGEGIAAKISMVEALGSETIVHTDVAGQKLLVVAQGQHNLRPGSDIRLSVSAAPLHLFNEKGLRLEHAV